MTSEAEERVRAWVGRFGPEVRCPVGIGPDPHDISTLLTGLADAESRLAAQRQLTETAERNRVAAEARALAVEEMLEPLITALEFYADPDVYHACGFMFDPPTGGWDEDFSEDHGHPDYDRPMPGKLARETLSALSRQKAQELGSLQLEDQGSLRPDGLRPCGANSEVETRTLTLGELIRLLKLNLVHPNDTPIRLIANGVAFPADDVWFEPRQDETGALCIGTDPR